MIPVSNNNNKNDENAPKLPLTKFNFILLYALDAHKNEFFVIYCMSIRIRLLLDYNRLQEKRTTNVKLKFNNTKVCTIY